MAELSMPSLEFASLEFQLGRERKQNLAADVGLLVCIRFDTPLR